MMSRSFFAIATAAVLGFAQPLKAEPSFHCDVDESWAIITGPSTARGQSLRGFMTYTNDSKDWFSCSASCHFSGVGGSVVKALTLNCSGVVTPGQLSGPVPSRTVGIFCASMVPNPRVGIVDGMGKANSTCSKIPSPILP